MRQRATPGGWSGRAGAGAASVAAPDLSAARDGVARWRQAATTGGQSAVR
ncbi:hypothetical protein [Amycolatopsis plumensis]